MHTYLFKSVVCAFNMQLDSSRLPSSLRTETVGADSTQAWSSPRRKARSTPRHLSDRQRQRRVHHQHKVSPDASTDEAPGEVSRTPRARRRELRSKIPIMERSWRVSAAVDTAALVATTVTAVARARTSDESA